MSVLHPEATKLFSAQAGLDALLPNALYSQAELEQLPLEGRETHFQIADFVRQAVDNQLEIPVTPEEGWRVATTFLGALTAASEEKEVWDGQQMYNTVVESLSRSLNLHMATPDTAADYLAALKATFDHGKLHPAYFVEDISRPIALSHPVLRHEADAKTQREYREFLTDPDTIGRLGNIISDTYLDYGDGEGESIDIGYDVCEDLLKDLGVKEAQETALSWGRKTAEHFKKIAELEQERPGSVALLRNFYGLRHFGRYNVPHLIRQFDSHGDTSKPYGIEVAAFSDQKGSFNDKLLIKSGALANLEREGEYYVRTLETASTRELHSRMSALDKLYGSEHKISFAIGTAHGSVEAMELDSSLEETLGSLTIRHNYGTAKKWFVAHPNIMLASCSTGEEHGIAQHLSRRLRAVVVAPEEDAAVRKLVVARGQDGSPKLVPQFTKEFSLLDDGRRVRTALYIDGERIEPDTQQYKEYFAELVSAY